MNALFTVRIAIYMFFLLISMSTKFSSAQKRSSLEIVNVNVTTTPLTNPWEITKIKTKIRM